MLFDKPPEEWNITTLGEVCSQGGGGIQTGPFGSQLHASDYVDEGIPSIMPANIGDNRISEEGIARITKEDADRLSKYLVQDGDIVYSRRGDVEKCALVRKHEDGWLCGTGCLRVRPGNGVVDPLFCSYFLSHPESREWISRHAVGATMPNLNTQILSEVPFLLPAWTEQKAIARVLGTLDEKIELNRKNNETLEGIAKALFKSWFVDFDPVRAKAEGRPTGLPDEVSELFPDSFEESELGEIPSGWKVDEIGNVVECVGGSTPSTKESEYWDEGVNHWATPKDLSDLSEPFLLDTAKKITDQGVTKISSGVLPVGTVLLSSRAPVGYVAVARVPVSVNQGFIAMKPCALLPTNFLLNWTLANVQQFKDRASGTTFAEISKKAFRPVPVLLPKSEVVNAFTETVEPLYEKVVLNMRQSASLTCLRDTLLPRLISGELRVPDAEKMLEEVGV